MRHAHERWLARRRRPGATPPPCCQVSRLRSPGVPGGGRSSMRSNSPSMIGPSPGRVPCGGLGPPDRSRRYPSRSEQGLARMRRTTHPAMALRTGGIRSTSATASRDQPGQQQQGSRQHEKKPVEDRGHGRAAFAHGLQRLVKRRVTLLRKHHEADEPHADDEGDCLPDADQLARFDEQRQLSHRQNNQQQAKGQADQWRLLRVGIISGM